MPALSMTPRLFCKSASVSALVLLACNPALATDICRQDNATYLEEISGARLTFTPNDYGAATYYQMELELPTGQIFDGEIIWGNGYSIPRGYLELRDCQPTEMNECRTWEAVVYAVGTDGLVDYIGLETASTQVLMPELSAHLHFFDRSRLDDDPWEITYADRFIFEGCE